MNMMKVVKTDSQPCVYTHTLSENNVSKKASKMLIQQTKNKNKPQQHEDVVQVWCRQMIQREKDSRMAIMDPKNSTRKML